MTDDGLTDAVVEREAVEAGTSALNRVHEIEREMLNRAIYSLSDVTGKSPEVVVGILCDGLDAEYQAAVMKVEAAARLAKTLIRPPTPKIVLPSSLT